MQLYLDTYVLNLCCVEHQQHEWLFVGMKRSESSATTYLATTQGTLRELRHESNLLILNTCNDLQGVIYGLIKHKHAKRKYLPTPQQKKNNIVCQRHGQQQTREAAVVTDGPKMETISSLQLEVVRVSEYVKMYFHFFEPLILLRILHIQLKSVTVSFVGRTEYNFSIYFHLSNKVE